jgi:Mg2+-importing ATPase
VLALGAWNAALETGLSNPLDDAILEASRPEADRVRKLGEVPFDFVRRRVSVVFESEKGIRLVTKGAFDQVLDVCTRSSDGSPLDPSHRVELQERFQEWSGRGVRVLAVAVRAIEPKPSYGRDDECALTFAGFLTFLDHPKKGVIEALGDLTKLGVSVRLITGDSKLVAQHVAGLVGLKVDRVLTGGNVRELNDEALWQAAERTNLFVEVDPNQKERIILALKKMGHVVGFLGDGVNDAPAMHAADTSLSVVGRGLEGALLCVDDRDDVAPRDGIPVAFEQLVPEIRRRHAQGGISGPAVSGFRPNVSARSLQLEQN